MLIFYCTNMNGAHLCEELEATLGLPILGSASIGLWKPLRLLGIKLLPGWGQLLS